MLHFFISMDARRKRAGSTMRHLFLECHARRLLAGIQEPSGWSIWINVGQPGMEDPETVPSKWWCHHQCPPGWA